MSRRPVDPKVISSKQPLSREDISTLRFAIAATDLVCNRLRDYADATDAPRHEAVEAADLMDRVADLLHTAVRR
jgi:hypothetical protein